MRLTIATTAIAGTVLWLATAVHAAQQTARTIATQSNDNVQKMVTPDGHSAISVAFIGRRSNGCCNCCVQPTVQQPAGQAQVAPPAVVGQQPQTTERRSLSVEPSAPVQTFNSAPTFRNRSRGPSASYLRADSKASRY